MTVCAPAVTSVEILRFAPESRRAIALFAGLTAGAKRQGLEVTDSPTYQGTADLLMIWGGGAPSRFGPMAQYRAQGKHVLCWDLAYWDRDGRARVSIDTPHPQAWLFRRDWPTDRLDRSSCHIADAWNPDGPILLAGIGTKATVQYGDQVAAWEAAMVQAVRPYGRQILYRHKRHVGPIPAGTVRASAAPIDTVLSGCSLVITWHSNVAIDAIRMGIPVVCRDGAAAAVCPEAPSVDQRPLLPSARRRFLANLAWFQWAPEEGAAFWSWLMECLA